MRFRPTRRGSFFGEYDNRIRSFFFGPAPTMSKPRMNDSSRKTCAMATFSRDDGISTIGWCARTALRMRVSMSAIGSVSNLLRLPARLGDAGDLALESKLPEADAAQRELPNERPRTPAALAAAVPLHLELRWSQRLRYRRFLRQSASATPLLAGMACRAAPTVAALQDRFARLSPS